MFAGDCLWLLFFCDFPGDVAILGSGVIEVSIWLSLFRFGCCLFDCLGFRFSVFDCVCFLILDSCVCLVVFSGF